MGNLLLFINAVFSARTLSTSVPGVVGAGVSRSSRSHFSTRRFRTARRASFSRGRLFYDLLYETVRRSTPRGGALAPPQDCPGARAARGRTGPHRRPLVGRGRAHEQFALTSQRRRSRPGARVCRASARVAFGCAPGRGTGERAVYGGKRAARALSARRLNRHGLHKNSDLAAPSHNSSFNFRTAL